MAFIISKVIQSYDNNSITYRICYLKTYDILIFCLLWLLLKIIHLIFPNRHVLKKVHAKGTHAATNVVASCGFAFLQ